MSHRRVLLENIASLAVLQALNYAVPLLTLPYLVRVLQPAQFGLMSFAQGLVLYFDLFTDCGFNFSVTRSIAVCKHEPESVSRMFWTTIYTKAFLMTVSAVVLTVLVCLTRTLRETPCLYAINFLYVIGTTFFPIWFFQGLERMKLAAGILAVARLLTIPALFLFVRNSQDYLIAAAIQASVEVTASILAWPIILSSGKLGWYVPSVREIKDTLRRAWPLFLSISALQLSSSSTTIVLGFARGKSEVGYFSAADKLIKAAISVLNPLVQALYPHITTARLRSRVSAFKLIRKALLIVTLVSLCVSLATAFWAEPACRLIFGKAFGKSAAVLQCLSPLPLLSGLMSVFGTQTMLVFEMDATLSKIMLLSAAVALPVTLGLAIFFGAVGAAAASVVVATFMVSAMVLALRSKGMHVWLRDRSQFSSLPKDSNAVLARE